jgi:hypothetical protein
MIEPRGDDSPAERKYYPEMPASAEEISELLDMASHLLHFGETECTTEVIRSCELGCLALQCGVKEVDGNTYRTATIRIAGPAYKLNASDILFEFDLSGEDGPIITSSDEDLDEAIDICVELITTRKLSETEVELTLFCNRQMSAIQNEQPITHLDGYASTSDMISAIENSVTERHHDFIRTTSVEYHDRDAGILLYIERNEPSNPYRHKHVPYIEIEYKQRGSNDITFKQMPDGEMAVIEPANTSEDYDSPPQFPEHYHVEKLESAVSAALEYYGIAPTFKTGITSLELNSYQNLALTALYEYQAFLSTPQGTKERAVAMKTYLKSMQALNKDFETRYHLVSFAQRGNKALLLPENMRVQHIHTAYSLLNVLLICAPVVYVGPNKVKKPIVIDDDSFITVEFVRLVGDTIVAEGEEANITDIFMIGKFVTSNSIPMTCYIPLPSSYVYGFGHRGN